MDDYLSLFKTRMRIFHNSEDDYLLSILNASMADIFSLCGEFDLAEEHTGLELIFERSRYAYNDSLEYFYDNFQTSILNLSIRLAGDSDGNQSEL